MTDNSSSSLYARAARGSLQLSGVRGSVVLLFLAKIDCGGGASFLDAFPCSLAVSLFDRAFFVLGNRLCPLEMPSFVSRLTRGDICFLFLSILLLTTSIARR